MSARHRALMQVNRIILQKGLRDLPSIVAEYRKAGLVHAADSMVPR